MRISDWSSDVCSSYLIVLTNHILIGEALEVALDGRDDIPDLLLIADTTLSQRWNLFPAVIERVFSIDMEWIEFEIGRASCREGVCQYVWFSVVAGSLKQKNQIDI